MAKRQVEVFTAGCPLCEPVVQLVKQVACDNCEVTVHNMSEPQAAPRAQAAGVNRVPVTEQGLRAAGVGAG